MLRFEAFKTYLKWKTITASATLRHKGHRGGTTNACYCERTTCNSLTGSFILNHAKWIKYGHNTVIWWHILKSTLIHNGLSVDIFFYNQQSLMVHHLIKITKVWKLRNYSLCLSAVTLGRFKSLKLSQKHNFNKWISTTGGTAGNPLWFNSKRHDYNFEATSQIISILEICLVK